MRDPVLLVAGLGRCGTSLLMQMLRAAGVPVAGRAPAFEDIPVSLKGVDLDWLDAQRGRAVKWIDPVEASIPNPEDWRYRVIFLNREAEQQAISQLKLLHLRSDRRMRRAMTARVARDTARAARIVNRLAGTHGVLHLRFEQLITRPDVAAAKLARFCDMHGFPFGDPDLAAAEVLPRGAGCASDLSIEIGQMQSAERERAAG